MHVDRQTLLCESTGGDDSRARDVALDQPKKAIQAQAIAAARCDGRVLLATATSSLVSDLGSLQQPHGIQHRKRAIGRSARPPSLRAPSVRTDPIVTRSSRNGIPRTERRVSPPDA